MKYHKQFVTLALLAALAVVWAKEKYLSEKPSFLQSCKLSDSNFNPCFAKNFEGTFKVWSDGIPGLKSVGSLDPLYVKRIGISQDQTNNLIQLMVDLTNVKLSGVSAVKISAPDVNLKVGSIKATLKVPKVHLESDYKVKGRLLNLELNGAGTAVMDITAVDLEIQMFVKLRDEYDYTFADVEKLKLKIAKIEGIHIDMQNLFNGNKELEDSTNALINQSWRDFYAVLGPAIEKAMHSVMFDRLKKVFEYVPVNYFIEDIPTAAVSYAVNPYVPPN